MCGLCLVSRSCRKCRRSVEKERCIIGCSQIGLFGFGGRRLLFLETAPSALCAMHLCMCGKFLESFCKV